MSTITLPNIRVSSDLTVKLKLKDGGVAIDWSTLTNIRVSIYSDAQKALAGRCSALIDEDDNTILVCQYAANKPQYVGVNRVVVSAKYMDETKTYDKPAFNFVRWTDDQEGQTITIDDPDIDVEISVEDVSSSILQEAVDAANTAAERANDAAEAAEHMVDIHTGPQGKSAYEVAVDEGYVGTEEQWLASLKGDTGETPDITIGTVTTVAPGTPAAATMTGTPEDPVLNLTIPQGAVGATPAFTVGTVTTGAPGSSVIVTISGTAEAPVLNVTIPQGMQGNTGSSVDYPYELVNNLTTNDATKGLTAAQGVVLDGKVSQLEAKVTDLQDGETVLQQQIDAINPVIIEGDVTNAPDSEDITATPDNRLKFADRPATLTNKGYKILRADKSFASQVTDINTIYEIRYQFDLNDPDGETPVTIPSGCTLKFNGGSIKNGTISGNNTRIISGDYQIFDSITFSGTFLDALNAYWVGAKSNDSTFDNSAIIQAWFSGYCNYFRELFFPLGTYYFLTGASLTSDIRSLVLNGGNSTFNVNIPTDDAYFLTLSNSSPSESSGENFRLRDVRIVNTKTTSGVHLSKTRALLLDRAQRFSIQNVQFWYFDIAVTLKDCWYGGFGGQSLFWGNRIGIHAPRGAYYELNAIDFLNVNFSGIDRATIETLYPQEVGETEADYLMRTAACAFDSYVLLQGVTLRGCTFERWDYGVRANCSKFSSSSTVSGGGFSIDGCYFEANRQEDFYFGIGNAANDGTGSSYIRYNHKVNIFGCRFHTRKHADVCGGQYVFINNEGFGIKVSESSFVATSIEYDGEITFDSVASNAIINKYSYANFAKIYQPNGSLSAGYNSIKPISSFGVVNQLRSRLKDFLFDSSVPATQDFVLSPWSFVPRPSVRYALDIKPFESFRDQRNAYYKLIIPSGGSQLPVSYNSSYNFDALNCNDGIPLYEFIRRWKAGTTYTGMVQNLFPYVVTANPTDGTVYNESGTLVGFGINGIGTLSFGVGYYLFVDGLVWMRFSYSRAKLYADHLQCGRDFQELRRGIDEGYYDTYYLSLFGTNADMTYVLKRLNAIYYDRTNSKLMIYNGFSWVEMTSPYDRYYYKSFGAKLSERATIPDMVGQTFHNTATGITYVFTFGGGQNARTPRWVSGVGLVDSLEHPNGYANDSTLDYANELTSGERVVCNNILYTWNGSSFVQENPVQALTAGGKKIWTGTQAEYDLLTPSNDTLYFITSS